MPRRNTGNYHTRKDRPGRIYLRTTHKGQRIHHGSYPNTKAERKEADGDLKRILSEQADGDYVQPGKITVGAYLEGWLDGLSLDIASGNLRANTAESYRLALVSKVIPRIGDVPLHLLTRDDVKGLYASLLASGGRKGKALAPKVGAKHCEHFPQSTGRGCRRQADPLQPC